MTKVYVKKRRIGNSGLWLEEYDKGRDELVRKDSSVEVGDTCQPMAGGVVGSC